MIFLISQWFPKMLPLLFSLPLLHVNDKDKLKLWKIDILVNKKPIILEDTGRVWLSDACFVYKNKR